MLYSNINHLVFFPIDPDTTRHDLFVAKGINLSLAEQWLLKLQCIYTCRSFVKLTGLHGFTLCRCQSWTEASRYLRRCTDRRSGQSIRISNQVSFSQSSEHTMKMHLRALRHPGPWIIYFYVQVDTKVKIMFAGQKCSCWKLQSHVDY